MMSAHRKSVTVGISISVTLLTLASWQRTAFAQQLPYQGGSLDGPDHHRSHHLGLDRP